MEGSTTSPDLDRSYQVKLPVVIPARGHVWYVFQ